MSTKTTTTSTETYVTPEQAKALGLPIGSAEFFRAIVDDAANWSGTPWFDGNIASGRSASGYVARLVKSGLIKSAHDDERNASYAVMTPAGLAAAQTVFGNTYLIDYYPEHKEEVEEMIKSAKATKVTTTPVTGKAVLAAAKSASTPAATKAAARKATTAKVTKATTKKATATKATAKAASKATTATEPKGPRQGKGKLHDHLVEVFAGVKKGQFLSASEISNAPSSAYPEGGARPGASTIAKLLGMATCPTTITPTTGGPKNVKGAVKK